MGVYHLTHNSPKIFEMFVAPHNVSLSSLLCGTKGRVCEEGSHELDVCVDRVGRGVGDRGEGGVREALVASLLAGTATHGNTGRASEEGRTHSSFIPLPQAQCIGVDPAIWGRQVSGDGHVTTGGGGRLSEGACQLHPTQTPADSLWSPYLLA